MIRFQKWPLQNGINNAGGVGGGPGILGTPYVGGGGDTPPAAPGPGPDIEDGPPPPPPPPKGLDQAGVPDIRDDGSWRDWTGPKAVVLKHLALDMSVLMQLLDIFTELKRIRSSSPMETFVLLKTQVEQIKAKFETDVKAANSQLGAAIGSLLASLATSLGNIAAGLHSLKQLAQAAKYTDLAKSKATLDEAENALEQASKKVQHNQKMLDQATKANDTTKIKKYTDLQKEFSQKEAAAKQVVASARKSLSDVECSIDAAEYLRMAEHLQQVAKVQGEVNKGISDILGAVLRITTEAPAERERKLREAEAQSIEQHRNLESSRQGSQDNVYSGVKDLQAKLADLINQLQQNISSTLSSIFKAI